MTISALPRLCIRLYLVLVGSDACAQSSAIDCDAVKKATVPFELSYHFSNGRRALLQSYRDQSGDGVIWNREESEQRIRVQKTTYIGGDSSEMLAWTTLPVESPVVVKATTEGLPKNFDHRSNVEFKVKSTTTYADGTSAERISINSYAFKSEDQITVGSCVFSVVRGELEYAPYPKTDKPPVHIVQLHFPELKLTVSGYGGEPVIDDLKTSFTPIPPIP